MKEAIGGTPAYSEPARQSPEWLKRSVLYQISLRAFTPEGTIKAASAKLPDLARLGIDIVYLCPICLQDNDMRPEYWSTRQLSSGMNNPCNPYRIKDYFQIDPEYGTDDDLRDFTSAAHSLGMRVILDLVYFHCGPSAIFLKSHPDFVKCDPSGKFMPGEWHFPLLDFDNQKLREYLWKNMEHWLKLFSIDGFRCDASDHVPLDFWEEAHRRIEKVNPEAILFAESGRNSDQLQGFDLNYSYLGWNIGNVILRKDSALKIKEAWNDLRNSFPRGSRFARFIDNHDIANDGNGARIESTWNFKGVNAALVAIFTLDGIPFLYNGQEIADKSKHSIYGKMSIEWSCASSAEGKARFALCQSLSSLRHAETAFTDGELIWLDNDHRDNVLSYMRKSEEKLFIVIVNLVDAPLSVSVKCDSAHMVFHSAILSSGATASDIDLNGDAKFKLEPFAYFIGELRNSPLPG